MYDYNDAYVFIKGTLDLLEASTNENNKPQKNVTFKNIRLFRSCISKIYSTLIDNAEFIGLVMSMYNPLKYSYNYFMASGSL